MSRLEGKVALVTGAGQGVGQGIALALAAEGCAVAVCGRTPDKLTATCGAVAARGGRAVPVTADVTVPADLARAVDETLDAFGHLDILVNNAQEVALGPLIDTSDEAFLRSFTSGPMATFRLMKACHPHMKARGGGVIVNLTSSVTRRWDMATYGTYAAVKQAIRMLTRAAAAEWGVDGIRVLSIAPHALSPGMTGWIDAFPEEAAAFFQTIPLRRVGACEEDIGRAVATLVGPEFGYLTGATIPLDGGQANFD
ncbi:SDR family oxidoreductase [Azospirillum sp. 412522]|nr:SDR family oxidoreductase [Azospirillum sp. 412522]MBY6262115.1 SDR family oxidoreductase [Azospirillum sp. 412522]